jgi:hypothetical protein
MANSSPQLLEPAVTEVRSMMDDGVQTEVASVAVVQTQVASVAVVQTQAVQVAVARVVEVRLQASQLTPLPEPVPLQKRLPTVELRM